MNACEATNMDNTIRITVYGTPQPGGSKKAFMHPQTGRAIVVDANPKAKSWKWQVACAALDQRRDNRLLDGPLAVTMTFYRPRPRGHYRSDGVTLRPSAPLFPATRPDALKTARLCEDALSGVIYTDDARIVDEHLYKRFGEPARVEIEILSLADTPAPVSAEVVDAQTRQLALVA